MFAAYRVVFDGGRTAVDAWQEHLDDLRTIDGTLCTRSLNGGTFTIAQQSLWAIQDMIEETRIPLTCKSYYVLSESNVNDWLGKRQGLRLVDLKIEAASRSLQLAETDFELTGSPDAGQAIQFYRDILTSLRSQQ
ncbi:hypothetical protein [Rubripirellula tenax]|uniref:hypothetical protein n=1 Tax=Rubripirellula tenax TaxID=2528015 RepID=UPI0011B80AD5|nr:hypothetical protein [Rubripirellula tenax]